MKMTKSMQDLTKDIKSTSEQRAEDITKIKDGTSSLRKEAADMVQDFQSSRRKGGDQLRKELAQGSKQLIQNEKKRKQEMGKMLNTFKSDRQESGSELRKNLAEGQAKMKSEVKEALTNAKTLINDFQTTRQQMASDLKQELEKSRDERNKDIQSMRTGFRKVQKELKDDLKGASDAWNGMGTNGHKKAFAGKTVKAEPLETPPNLEERLLTIINQHPAGITLSEVAKELGIVTIVLGKAAKVLLEQGKVRKEDKSYFPVIT
jgi:hypothetical protein